MIVFTVAYIIFAFLCGYAAGIAVMTWRTHREFRIRAARIANTETATRRMPLSMVERFAGKTRKP